MIRSPRCKTKNLAAGVIPNQAPCPAGRVWAVALGQRKALVPAGKDNASLSKENAVTATPDQATPSSFIAHCIILHKLFLPACLAVAPHTTGHALHTARIARAHQENTL